MGLDFDLPAQLVLHTLLFYLRLEEDLESHDEMAFLLSSQVHISKLAFAQRTPDLKVVDGEGAPDERWGEGRLAPAGGSLEGAACPPPPALQARSPATPLPREVRTDHAFLPTSLLLP